MVLIRWTNDVTDLPKFINLFSHQQTETVTQTHKEVIYNNKNKYNSLFTLKAF